MTDLTPSKGALYQRQRRLAKKIEAQKKQDIIEKQIALASKKQKIIDKTHKDANWDFTGREPQANLVPQYPDNKDEYAFNVWGSASDTQPKVNPLSKISYSDNLRKLFFNRAE
jgi:hypothetical protein